MRWATKRLWCLSVAHIAPSQGRPPAPVAIPPGGVVCCGVPKALLPQDNGRDVYPRVQVNGRVVCLSARCVLVCCCTAGTYALSHLAGTVLPTPMHGHTGSMGPTAMCVLCCTISTLCALPHWLVLCSALHCVCLAALHLWAVGTGQRNFCNVVPLYLRAVGSGAPALHRHTAWRPWAVELLQRTASPPGGNGQCTSCNTLPHYLGAVGSAIPAFALPHCLGAVGSGIPTMHCLTTEGQWAAQLLWCTASLLLGSGQWSSCFALPQGLGAVGCGTPATHCLTPWGQWGLQVVWCGVVWCGVVWCGVVWCGVVWCGVVWCGVVCRRRYYQMAKAGMSTHGYR